VPIKTDRNGGPQAILAVENVTKVFGSSATPFYALRNVSLEVRKGEMAAITGKSGSGKSTLLNLLSGIDRPSSGTILVDGVSPATMKENELAIWRGRSIGVVFQFFQLLPTLTVLENVVLPMDFCNTYPAQERERRARALLGRVGIADQADKFPATLSGGQQQRAAIARAIANDPPLLVADEPTGNLDSQTSQSIFALFRELAKTGKTIIVVTHESDFAAFFDTSFTLQDGVVIRKEGVVNNLISRVQELVGSGDRQEGSQP
jgi:putative ABC transport system ATP-binding protein